MGVRLLLSFILMIVTGCYQSSLPPRDVKGPALPKHPKAENFTIHHPLFVQGPGGAIVGIKTEGRLFELKPEFTYEIDPLMKAGKELAVSAVGHDSLYIVLSVTIDHKTFLVR